MQKQDKVGITWVVEEKFFLARRLHVEGAFLYIQKYKIVYWIALWFSNQVSCHELYKEEACSLVCRPLSI